MFVAILSMLHRSQLSMHIRVVSYNPRWVEEFALEAARIRDVFGGAVLAIHHIGSTSVPGLQAKPIIDMLPIVVDITRVDRFNAAMQDLGYEGLGEFGIPGRRYFRKGGDDRTHQAHIFAHGDPGIERHLAFRDYLRAHPAVATAYGILKARLAQQFPEDIYGYMDGKDAFIKAHEQKALAWHRAVPHD
jgi:GrpB-like predicted nucleotidyltransferase (UPF0157 family)